MEAAAITQKCRVRRADQSTQVRTADPTANRWMLFVFVAALVVGLAYLCSPFFPVRSAFSEEERIAIHLAHGEGFLSPFADGAGAPPTSWCPPVYPFLVSFIYDCLGARTSSAILAVLIFNQLCRAAAAAAVFQLGRKVGGVAVGLIAATIVIADPILLRSATFCWDNCLALAMFCWLLRFGLNRGDAEDAEMHSSLLSPQRSPRLCGSKRYFEVFKRCR